MNRRDYDIFEAGRQAAKAGGGLSDSPYGGRDGHTWRRGVQAVLDTEPEATGTATGLLTAPQHLHPHLHLQEAV